MDLNAVTDYALASQRTAKATRACGSPGSARRTGSTQDCAV